MLKRSLLVFGLVTCAVSAISMEGRCWELGGEAIYWKPCAAPYDYATDVRGIGTKTLSIQADYDWGFRIFAHTYTHDCCHLWMLDWTYLRTSDSIKQPGEQFFVQPSETVLNTNPVANARLKFRYNRINLRAGRYVSHFCSSSFYGFGGLRYVDLEREQQVIATDDTGSVIRQIERAEFEGAAFEVGAGIEADEGCNLAMIGHFAGVMGIGQQRLHQQLNSQVFDYDTHTACIPGLELRVGFQYRYECDCFWLTAQVGYHIDHYFNAFRVASGAQVINGSPTPLYAGQDVGFAGPFLNLAVRF